MNVRGFVFIFLEIYNNYSLFPCVESGRTHKDICLELAPLSAHGKKYQ